MYVFVALFAVSSVLGTAMTAEAETAIPTDGSTVEGEIVYFVGFTLSGDNSSTTGYKPYDNSGADKLFDKTNNKLCLRNITGVFPDGDPYWVEFSYSDIISPEKVYLRTAGDTSTFPNRNPVAWVLKAKLKESDEWSTVLEVNYANAMTTENNTASSFGITQNGAYKYFRIEFIKVGVPTSEWGSDDYNNDVPARRASLQLSELYMSGWKTAAVMKAPTAKSITYNGSAQALVTAGEAANGTMQYSTDGTNYSETVSTGTNAGTYTVYYKVKGNGDYKDFPSASLDVTIAKANSTITTLPTSKDLTYDGTEQELVNEGSTTGGTLQYSLDNSTYGTDIPKGTDAKTYTVWYKVSGDTNYNSVDPASLDVIIAKADSKIITTPTSKDLTYNAAEQELVTKGEAENGTIYYALGTDDTAAPTDESAWSDSIPKGTQAGTYYVWYKVKGNENYNDRDPVCVKAIISEAPALELTVTGDTALKRGKSADIKITVTNASQNITWTTNGTLPAGLTANGNDYFSITGTVDANAEIKTYQYMVTASTDVSKGAKILNISVAEAEKEQEKEEEKEKEQEKEEEKEEEQEKEEEKKEEEQEKEKEEEKKNATDAATIKTLSSADLKSNFENKTEIVISGKSTSTDISEAVKKIETVTTIETLDLSKVTGTSEIRLEDTNVKVITFEGNQEIEEVTVSGDKALTELIFTDSSVKEVVADACEKLEKISLESCDKLQILSVNEANLSELDLRDCVSLDALYCASNDLGNLNIDVCTKIQSLDCSYNHLRMLEISEAKFMKLGFLLCNHQTVYSILPLTFNFNDFLTGSGVFTVSTASEVSTADDGTYFKNVSNVKAYDESGNEISVNYNDQTGEVVFGSRPDKITYDYNTGFKGIIMDVQVFATSTAEQEALASNGGCGGCSLVRSEELGVRSVLMLLLFALILNPAALKKRKA